MISPPLLDIEEWGYPVTLNRTLVDYSRIIPRYLLINSGDSRHSSANSPDLFESKFNKDPVEADCTNINYITFQVPFDL